MVGPTIEDRLGGLEAALEELSRLVRTLPEERFLGRLGGWSPRDPSFWERDFGVRHQGAPVTIGGTVDELVADYAHHRRQIEELAGDRGVSGREPSA